MTALHVVVHPRPAKAPNPAIAHLNGVLDVIDGVNLTARIGEGRAIDFVTDLGFALASLCNGPRHRVQVPLHVVGELWELGMELDQNRVVLAIYCSGPTPSVPAYGQSISLRALRDAVLAALEQAPELDPALSGPLRAGIRSARAALAAIDAEFTAPAIQREPVLVRAAAGGVELSAELELSASKKRPRRADARLERADLHALLCHGNLGIRALKRQLVTGPSQVFLDTEKLVALAQSAFDSFASAQPTFRRTQLEQARISLRRGGGDASVELTFQAANKDPSSARVQRLSCADFVRLVAGFARNLVKEFRRRDSEHELNLRLTELDRQAERLLGQIEEHRDEESVTNPQPDTYRRFVPRVRRAEGLWDRGPKMRFVPRWVAAIAELDLRATFLCGERFIVGSAHETTCLKRNTGEVVWQKSTHPAACVVSPAGLVRIESDGLLSCHDLADGEVRFTLRTQPRSSRAAAGSVLHGPGLPELLTLVEGDRQVSAIDLLGGTVRWRYSMKRPAGYRLRRAGRLLLVAGGDPQMVALDAVTGEPVWSLRARVPFSGEISVDHDSAFALSGSNGGRFHLHRFNPFSGRMDWQVELDERPMPGRAPLLTPDAVVIPTLESEGFGVLAFSRLDGSRLWEYAPGLLTGTCAWLAVDDCILVNSSSGVLLGLGAEDGKVRFNHVFSAGSAAEQPRRLEPVLRSGALFVPQEKIHVVRPKDGELLGTLPTDLIPDLIRVDERCDVYVAEESGHLAAFGAAPRLALVR
jgi:outer membrane protein assembly factor BamB